MTDELIKYNLVTLGVLDYSDRDNRLGFMVAGSDATKEPYHVYRVGVNEEHWICSCKNFYYRGPTTECKHIRIAKEFLEDSDDS